MRLRSVLATIAVGLPTCLVAAIIAASPAEAPGYAPTGDRTIVHTDRQGDRPDLREMP